VLQCGHGTNLVVHMLSEYRSRLQRED
jgi:hypothetical protein